MANTVIGAFPGDVLTAAEMEAGRGFGLGDRYVDHLGREFVFVTFGAGGATGAGYVCSINADFSAVMATNTLALFGQHVGIAQAAAVAGEFGWLQIYGNGQVWSDVAVVAVRMQTTTTAGQIDDASGTGTKQIPGLSLTAARTGSAGLAPAILTYPHVGATN
jgi:hypothetical protein